MGARAFLDSDPAERGLSVPGLHRRADLRLFQAVILFLTLWAYAVLFDYFRFVLWCAKVRAKAADI